ncbi:cell division protein FtsK [Actinoplanes sp. NPDC051346]|uniref:cell division protein FtsK n=1 Tax=Actinoplanes sp. NPDC051346 TaxID=3155048 RepID=UPI00343649A4
MNNPTPDPDHVDWRAAEADPSAPADVVDLAAARTRRTRPDDTATDTHFDAAIDEEPQPGGMPVDPPAADDKGRQPIVPLGLSTLGAIKSTIKYGCGLAAYHAGFHGLRAPWYALQAGFWGTVGVFKLIGRQLSWWWVTEQTGLRQKAADDKDWQAWHKLHREVKATRAWRFCVLAGEATTLAIGAPILWTTAPWWALCLIGVLAVAGLARMGRPSDRPIVTSAVVTGRFRRINPDIVLRAYYAANLGHPDKPGQQVAFGGTMARDRSDTGSQVIIDLPYGKTWEQVLNAKGAIASGLDVSVNQVFLTRDPSSHRRHLLFVADRDPLAVAAGRTPLLDGKPRDIWTDVPLGLDERGNKVGLLLLWISVLIGAQPRKGKTYFARMVALFAALDPYVRLTVVDGKLSPDWDKFRLVAHRIIFGTVPNARDHDPITHLLDALREIKKHIEDANEFLSTLPTSECPDGKLTRELSRKYPQLRVWVLVMEEFQTYFETDDQAVNKEIASLLAFIMAVGPSAGVILISCTQKPSGIGAGDVSRLFNRFRDNHTVRFGLKCGNRDVSMAVLGSDAYSEGFDASSLPSGSQYRGVGILYGASDDTPIVRSYLADAGDAEKILQAAREHRERLGLLTGEAAGEKIARAVRDSLADVRSVFVAGETGLWWSTVAERLAGNLPEHYADLTAEATSALLREHVPSVSVKVRGTVNRGCRLTDIDTAMKGRKTA